VLLVTRGTGVMFILRLLDGRIVRHKRGGGKHTRCVEFAWVIRKQFNSFLSNLCVLYLLLPCNFLDYIQCSYLWTLRMQQQKNRHLTSMYNLSMRRSCCPGDTELNRHDYTTRCSPAIGEYVPTCSGGRRRGGREQERSGC
jgi:hypothetical protein